MVLAHDDNDPMDDAGKRAEEFEAMTLNSEREGNLEHKRPQIVHVIRECQTH